MEGSSTPEALPVSKQLIEPLQNCISKSNYFLIFPPYIKRQWDLEMSSELNATALLLGC